MCVIPSEILIRGDFNIHLDTPGNSNALRVINILKDFNLVQHVLESTHENGHLLDLIISRPTDFVSNVAVGEFFSDHRLVTFSIKVKNGPKKMITSRNFKNMNKNLLMQDIKRNFQSMKPVATSSELDNVIENYSTTISGLIDIYAPLRTRYVKLRPQAPWLAADIMEEKKRDLNDSGGEANQWETKNSIKIKETGIIEC